MSGISNTDNQIEDQDGMNAKNNNVIKVAIADDHALFRTGVKNSLTARKDIQMVAEAENGLQLLNLLRHIQPDIILLDIQMPIMDGMTTLKELKILYPNIKVIILSMHNDHDVISKMMELGANCYLTKESGSDMIYEAVRGVFENDFYFNELTNKALLSGLLSKRAKSELNFFDDLQLTDNEIKILKLMCDEKSINEIANIVELSPRTVEAIRDKLKAKTGTKSMAGLVMYAIKAGLLDEKMDEIISLISKEQMTDLFKITNSILSYVNHDLAGQRSIIYNALDQLKEELQKTNKSEIYESGMMNHVERAIEATGNVSSINRLIKSYVNISRSNDPNKLFITWPNKIVESIKLRNNNAEIKVLSSVEDLRIIYPNVILYSIISELIENAKKNTKEELEINIKWNMKGNVFHCEIHDNGPGFKGIQEKQNVPMSMLQLEHMGMGLKIIERTLIDSKGLLFFSKSDLLGGAKIYFEFPVFDFTS